MLEGIQRFAGDRIKDLQKGYNQTDLMLDGWLPGGAKQSPLRKSYPELVESSPGYAVGDVPKPNNIPITIEDGEQPFSNGKLTTKAKKYVEALAPKGTTVTDNVDQTNSLTSQKIISNQYLDGSHANPFKGQIYLAPHQNNYDVLAHEIGHLDTNRTGRPYLAVSGRILTEGADMIGNSAPILKPLVAPIKAAGGLLRSYVDAPEEEYAERFTKAVRGDDYNKHFRKDGYSNYGSSEYSMGTYHLQNSLHEMNSPLATALDIPFEGVKPSQRRKLK